jgi:hypothetical protein
MTLLDQLQADQNQISAILKTHCEEVEAPVKTDVAIDMLYSVYMDCLKDTLTTLNTIIEDLKKRG